VSFTPEEEEEFLTLSREPNLYDKLTRSVSPAISGDYTKDIKKAWKRRRRRRRENRAIPLGGEMHCTPGLEEDGAMI